MKHYRLPSGKELFIGGPSDGFMLATYQPAQPALFEPKQIDPSEFRIDLPGGVFDTSRGKDADEMLKLFGK